MTLWRPITAIGLGAIELVKPTPTRPQPDLHDLAGRWSDEEKRRRLGADVVRHPASRLGELLPWNWKGRSARLVA
jgi:hypothetical protein